MVGKGLFREVIQGAGLHIGFELTFPGNGVKFSVPAPELGEFLLR